LAENLNASLEGWITSNNIPKNISWSLVTLASLRPILARSLDDAMTTTITSMMIVIMMMTMTSSHEKKEGT